MPRTRRQQRDTTAVLNDLRRIVRALRESSRAAERRLGVTGAQLFVLRALAGTQARSLNELAARTHTHQSTVSVVVKRLAARRLVRRTTSPLDRRRLELSVTAQGRAVLERAPLAAQDVLVDGLDRLADEDRQALAVALRRLVAAMGLRAAEPTMFFEPGS
jgi:DNA-binding MarR family transcriptional regulator